MIKQIYLTRPRMVVVMANLVLVVQAEQETMYTADHIRHLLTRKTVKGEKHGRIWLVDLDDLKQYEAKMKKVGTKKYDPTKKKNKK